MKTSGTQLNAKARCISFVLIMMLLSASGLTGSVVYRKKRKNGSR